MNKKTRHIRKVSTIIESNIKNQVLPFIRHHWRAMAVIAALICLCLGIHFSVPRPLFCSPTSSVAYAANGALLSARIAPDGQWRFAETGAVSKMFETCITTFEDHRFRYHPGIDPMAIVRALRQNIEAGSVVEGGSTLTMQVARMARGNRDRTLWQKMIESVWALSIEISHTKDEILCLYASHAPFGGNVVGIEAAAWRYFGRAAADLSWAENALLAVLPNSPALIHVGRNRSALLEKRNKLLLRLRDNGSISNDDYELAIGEPLPDKPYPLDNRTPHLLNFLGTGQSFTTTIDESLQRRLQNIADSHSLRYRSNLIDNIGVLVAEVATGNVIAYIGNASDTPQAADVDMVRAQRSTGSILKPFLYAAMMSAGEITPSMLFADTPLDINGFIPQNYTRIYSGAVSADQAIMKSLNVPLVRMLSEHNTGRFLADLKQLGMTTLHYSDEHYGASLILGGAEAKLWDLCGMYASMARMLNNYNSNGHHILTDAVHGLRATPDGECPIPSRYASATMPTPAAIWYAFEAMSALNRPEEEAEWQQFNSMKRIAWKTGTSFGARDAWAVGVTPSYVVGVWVGNASGEGRAGLTGVGFAGPVMLDAFSLLPGSGWFEKPVEDMDPFVVCRHSGCLASETCAETDTLLLPRQAASTQQCRYCRPVHLTANGEWQVNSSCEPTANIRTESRFVLPPIMEYYYRQTHADYIPLPPMRNDCETDDSDGFAIIYPEPHHVVVCPRDFGGKLQRIVASAALRRDNGILYWHLDGSFIGSTQTSPHQMALELDNGHHRLTVVDERGASRSVDFESK